MFSIQEQCSRYSQSFKERMFSIQEQFTWIFLSVKYLFGIYLVLINIKRNELLIPDFKLK